MTETTTTAYETTIDELVGYISPKLFTRECLEYVLENHGWHVDEYITECQNDEQTRGHWYYDPQFIWQRFLDDFCELSDDELKESAWDDCVQESVLDESETLTDDQFYDWCYQRGYDRVDGIESWFVPR